MQEQHHPLVIIGGGPAGYTAAIYASRAGLSPILYQGAQPGGQLTTTTLVENYPGFPDGILGPQMMDAFRRQAERFGTQIRMGTITHLDFSQNPYSITIDGQKKITTKSIIIATGSSPKWLRLPSEQALIGKGVSSCATCDGFFFKNQDVAVVGGGDSAAEESLYLSKLCQKVYLLVRRDTMRASLIMQERVKQTPNITILWNTQVTEVLGDEAVTGLKTLHNLTQSQAQLTVKALFVAIGHQPNTTFTQPHLTLDPLGYIQTKAGTTQTNIRGVFAAGDVQDSRYRQAITAAGSGCMAALEAERFLNE